MLSLHPNHHRAYVYLVSHSSVTRLLLSSPAVASSSSVLTAQNVLKNVRVGKHPAQPIPWAQHEERFAKAVLKSENLKKNKNINFIPRLIPALPPLQKRRTGRLGIVTEAEGPKSAFRVKWNTELFVHLLFKFQLCQENIRDHCSYYILLLEYILIVSCISLWKIELKYPYIPGIL